MAGVFISYSHQDRAVVQELARVVAARGISCWWDREIAVGSDLRASIDRELIDADAVIVVWSESSVNSHWVHSEASDALENGKLLPVAIADVKIPLPFRGLETARLINWPTQEDNLQLQKLIAAMESLVSSQVGMAGDVASLETLDPSLSVRIANRVSDALLGRSDGEDTHHLKRMVSLETALTDAALALLDGASTEVISAHLVDAVERYLDATTIVAWYGQELVAGTGNLGAALAASTTGDYDQLMTKETESDEQLSILRAYNLDWLYLCKRAPVTLCLGGLEGDQIDTLKRVPVIADLFRKAHDPQRA